MRGVERSKTLQYQRTFAKQKAGHERILTVAIFEYCATVRDSKHVFKACLLQRDAPNATKKLLRSKRFFEEGLNTSPYTPNSRCWSGDMGNTVVKYGGTSLKDQAALELAAQQVKEHSKRVFAEDKNAVYVVVVSGPGALGEDKTDPKQMKLTDLLENVHKLLPGEGQEDVNRGQRDRLTNILEERVKEHCKAVNVDTPEVAGVVSTLAELSLGKQTDMAYSNLVHLSELVNELAFTQVLRGWGMHATHRTWNTTGIFTERGHKNARIIPGKTNQAVRQEFKEEKGKVVVVPGFCGMDYLTGALTTIGRGGSDTTATTIGSALNASKIIIYSDQDGLLTADPRIVHHPQLAEYITHLEAIAAARIGAQIICETAIQPAYRARKEVMLKNATHPERKGTVIGPKNNGNENRSEERRIRCVVSQGNYDLFRLREFPDEPGVVAQVTNYLREQGINISLTGGGETSETYALRNDQEGYESIGRVRRAVKKLGFKCDFECDVGRIALIKEDIIHNPQAIATMDAVLQDNNIKPVWQPGLGRGEASYSRFIREEDLEVAVKLVHDALF
jgi:aspartate kinase